MKDSETLLDSMPESRAFLKLAVPTVAAMASMDAPASLTPDHCRHAGICTAYSAPVWRKHGNYLAYARLRRKE